MLFRRRVKMPGLLTKVYKSKGGLWYPEFDTFVDTRSHNVLAVLRNNAGMIHIPGVNIVTNYTNGGDQFYAQQAVGDTPTPDFSAAVGRIELVTAISPALNKTVTDKGDITVVAAGASRTAYDATYPKVSDADTDNTGSGDRVVTYLGSWSKTDFNQTGITHGEVDGEGATPVAADPLLTAFAFAASFDKTADDTLKVFINHTMNGV